MALLAMLYTRTFYGCKRLFDRLPMPRHFRPAVGAFLTGLVAVCLYVLASCFVPSPASRRYRQPQQVLAVLAFGYSAIQDAMMQDTRRGLDPADDRAGKDPHDWPDDRQRRLGRRLRPVDGDRRMRRRGLGIVLHTFGPAWCRIRRAS